MSRYDHIRLPDLVDSLRYSPRPGRGDANIPSRDRVAHAALLQRKFEDMRRIDDEMKVARNAISLPTRTGTYVEFKGAQNCDLMTQSLEAVSANVRLMNVRNVFSAEGVSEIYATVFIPRGEERKFLNKLHDYATADDRRSGRPKNEKLINSIDDISVAFLQSFWTDSPTLFPDANNDWYEVWIKIDDSGDKAEQVAEFQSLLRQLRINHKPNYLLFPERAVILVNANRTSLLEILNSSDSLSELKAGKEPAGFWTNQNSIDQTEWIEDLLRRLVVNQETNVSVCILDTGVNNGHPLLSPIINDDSCLTYDQDWVAADRRGHGTMMAGVCTYGDLSYPLQHNNPIEVSHTLCSVKILPDTDDNPKELWGDITRQCVYKAEITLPNRKMIYCMAVTSEDDHMRGTPSSWSAAVDYMCMGAEEEEPRLIIVSAGNVDDDETRNNYPNGNTVKPIHNPAQSWNALTVGAYTEKIHITDPNYDEHERLAPSGGICPYSTTSVLWDKKWPIKPDVVFEGGNLLRRNNSIIPYIDHDDLEVLTTSHALQNRQFETINGTSSACALASNLAGEIAAKYPDLWPESIRGLIVHSAQWTDTMYRQFGVNGRNNLKTLLRSCGYGVPNRERALFSTENGFTFIAQNTIKPYARSNNNSINYNEMNFYSLPWPNELLAELGEAPVTLRVTLSYYIEPSPGEIGWKDKYRYQSFGFRFDINNSQETQEQFKRRINRFVSQEEGTEEVNLIENDSARWQIGINNRSAGSIHSDTITTTAADLSSCNLIAVFPVVGWWKLRSNLQRYNSKTRYSLLISLDTPVTEIDLYNVVQTKIANIIQTPVEIDIPV